MWEEEFIILDPTSFPMERTRGATLCVVGAVCSVSYERHLLDPVSISGSYGVMRAGSLLPHWRRLYLDIHPPIHPRDYRSSDQPMQDLREQVYHTIQQGIHDGTEQL